MRDDARLGEPIELPWWVLALAAPPAVVALLGLVLNAPWWGRSLAVVTSVAMIVVLIRVATRVASRNLQSVWVSLAMAVWFFCAVTWIAAVMSAGR